MKRMLVAAVLAAAPAHAAEVLAGPYPAEIVRIVDGDTVEARVRVWLGVDVTALVRIRGIDAPELRGRCPGEPQAAEAARDHLAAMLAGGRVWLSEIGHDKYGQRVNARLRLASGADVAEAMLAAGHALAARRGRANRCGPRQP
jgi:endonuclease YncB( thermonuclease family)